MTSDTRRMLAVKNPLVPFAVAYMAGIAVGHDADLGAMASAVVLALLAVVAITTARLPVVRSAVVTVAMAVAGTLLVTLRERSLNVALPNAYEEYAAVVSDEPVDKGNVVRMDVIVASGRLAGHTARLFVAKDRERTTKAKIGEGLRVWTKLKKPENYRKSNFDYATFLYSRGMVATAYVAADCWQKANVSLVALSLVERTRLAALTLRHRLLDGCYRLGLSGQTFAVVAAMTLGDKSTVSAELSDAYSVAGASHILALSGMHIGVVYTLLSLLARGRRLRTVRELLLTVAVWAYVFVVGMPSSALRAAVMISVYSFLKIAGRRRMTLNALAFAAMLLLVANPLCLYDISFQLSFIAVAFILVFNGKLSSLVSQDAQQRHPLLRASWQLITVSTVAQLGTAPLVAYYFGRVSLSFLLSNMIVIPTATLIIYSSAALLPLALLPPVQQLLAGALAVVVSTLNYALLYISHLPYSSIENIHINTLQTLLLYAATVALLSVPLHTRPRIGTLGRV